MNRTIQLLFSAGLLAALMGCGAAITPTQISLGVSSSQVTAESTLTLTAKAEGSSLAKVAFYDGANKLGEDDSAPFMLEVKLTKDQNGERTYRSVAMDGQNTILGSSEKIVKIEIFDTTTPAPNVSTESKQRVVFGVAGSTARTREGLNPCGSSACIGDDRDNQQVRGSLSFTLNDPSLKPEQLVSATLKFYQVGGRDTYAGLGELLVLSDTRTELARLNDPAEGFRSLDVTDYVKQYWQAVLRSPAPLSQDTGLGVFTFEFTTITDNDNLSDLLMISGGRENGPNQPPSEYVPVLILTYKP